MPELNHIYPISNKKIAILIPAYNESKNIKEVIKGCQNYNIDIIIVDDGSTDGTLEVIKSVETSSKSKIILKQHSENLGKGEALKTGFKYILDNGYDGVITIDADGQHNPVEIEKFITSINKDNPDIIVGSRFRNIKGMPFDRIFANTFSSWLISLIAGKKIEDVQSGFRYIDAKTLRGIKLETKNFDTESEILLKASWKGYNIINIPISTIYHKNFTSYFHPVKDTLKFFKLLFKSLCWKINYKSKKKLPVN